jgi:hypothetical protein
MLAAAGLDRAPQLANPLRVVALLDLVRRSCLSLARRTLTRAQDCFYASVESVRLGLSPDVPLAVQQWQVRERSPVRARLTRWPAGRA